MNEGRILQLVTFKLGDEEFGVDILKVQEINRMMDITRIPNAPPFIEGVINLRGKIIPIVDLRKRLGFLNGTSFTEKTTRIIVVELDGLVLAGGIFGVEQQVDAGQLAHGFEEHARRLVVHLEVDGLWVEGLELGHWQYGGDLF